MAIVDQMLLFDPPRIDEAVAALKEGIQTSQQPGTQLLFAHRLFHFMSECGQDPGRYVVCMIRMYIAFVTSENQKVEPQYWQTKVLNGRTLPPH